MEHPERAEEQALRVNGYNEVDWMFAIDRKKAMEEFSKKTQSCTFVSHNLVFDYGFVMKAFEEIQQLIEYYKKLSGALFQFSDYGPRRAISL